MSTLVLLSPQAPSILTILSSWYGCVRRYCGIIVSRPELLSFFRNSAMPNPLYPALSATAAPNLLASSSSSREYFRDRVWADAIPPTIMASFAFESPTSAAASIVASMPTLMYFSFSSRFATWRLVMWANSWARTPAHSSSLSLNPISPVVT
ncbi:MAG: hypothetical protein A4E62_03023 [Syntrophorhabdus sp. PtaU1.Bin002]|nr:MAG: hypothetical protein A4E62_03023 [Syntrophorhabdus sp. PtaU1.Bin002]